MSEVKVILSLETKQVAEQAAEAGKTMETMAQESAKVMRDEAAKTPNVIVHDKDFNVIAKYRFGRNNGLDFVPGGKDGAVRFAWAFTPNWMNGKQEPMVPIYGIVQFAELKDGQVSDLTYYGGFSTFIER